MSTGLRRFLSIADWAMLGYWVVMGAACIGLLSLPTSAMYDGYGTAHTDAWNWSFVPLDVAFAVAGLIALRMASSGDPRWNRFAIFSLALTMCAGGMAISYWAIIGEFNPWWWIPNLALLVVPLVWLPKLLSDSPRSDQS